MTVVRDAIPMLAVRRAGLAAAGLALAWTFSCGNSSAWSATFTWSSTAVGTSWNAASNWGGTVPGSQDTGQYSAASYTSQPSLASSAAIGGIWDTGGGAVTIGGTSSLTLFGTTVNSNTSTGIEVDAAAGPLTVNAPLVLQNNQQWINNSASPLTVNGAISGSGSLTKIGLGLLTLTGVNTYSGATTVDGGTMQVSSGGLTSPTQFVGYSAAGSFTQSGGANAASNILYVGYNTGSSGSYGLTGGSLYCGTNEYVGYSGSGSFAQSGGTNSLPGAGVDYLYLGYNTGGSGTYTLGGSGLLAWPYEYLGGDIANAGGGDGSITQSSGTNTVANYLRLGLCTGSSGAYSLTGSGLLNANSEWIGYSSSGSFTQSGGTNLTASLYVGYGLVGTYSLGSNGLLTASNAEYIAYSGTGTFTQSGGTNAVATSLYIAYEPHSKGAYSLTSGSLWAESEYVGDSALGSFTQSAGTNTAVSILYVGQFAGSSGTYALSGGYFSASSDYIGDDGSGIFTQSGGTHTTGGVNIGEFGGSSGTYSLSGGPLIAGVEIVGSGSFTQSGGANSVSSLAYLAVGDNGLGTYSLTGSGLLSAPFEYIGNFSTGIFTQSGGSNAVSIGLYLGYNRGSGSYNLSGSGLISTTYEDLGFETPGSFTQSGGTHAVSTSLILGYAAGSSGTYGLSGSGLLSAQYEYIGYAGSGSFTQSGGTNAVSGGLVLAQYGSAAGTYSLDAGLLTLGPGGMTRGAGSAAFNLGGGTLGATAPWSSSMNLSLNLTGAGGNATVDTTGGNITLEGNLTGSGTLNKVGPGILSLSGTSSTLAVLNVNSGTLQILGGLLTAGNEYAGYSGNAAITQSGGTNAISSTLYLGVNGTYNLAGGLLVVPSILESSGPASLNVSGGTLTAGSVTVPIVVTNSPVINSNGPFADAAPFSGPGNVTATGSGIKVLSGSSSNTGDWTISQGSVELANANALNNATVVLDVDYGLLFGPGIGNFNIGGLAGSGAFALNDLGGGPVTLAVGGNNADTTFSGSIGGLGGLIKSGSGKITLLGNNSYTGGTRLDPGIVSIASDAALGDPAGLATAGGLTANVIFENNGALQAGGTFALSPNRTIAIAAGATATLDSQGYTLTIDGPISGGGGLAKVGSGTLVLGGGNSYTGATTIVAGTLMLDFSQPGAPAANILNNVSNSTPLALGGGTLAIQGNANTANSQQFNGLTVSPGCSAIVLTAASNPLVLNLGSISRPGAGGTVDFTLPGGAPSATNGVTTTSANTNGILGGYATVSGTDWAASTGTAGNITAYSAYTGGNLGALGSNAALNVEPSGLQSALTTADSFNTLNLSGTAGVAMSGSGSLALASGGLIGNTSGIISGGTLQGSAASGNAELIVITPQNLTITSVIADNGGATALTKAGAGMLTLAGSNTYSGMTTIGSGTLQVGNGGATGNLGSGPVNDGACLVFNLAGASGFSGAISGSGSLTKTGSGIFVLGGSNGFSGLTTISQGALQLANSAALSNTTVAINAGNTVAPVQFSPGIGTFVVGGLCGGSLLQLADTSGGTITLVVGGNGASTTFGGAISGNGALTKTGGGTLVLSGSGSYSGGTLISGGVLQIGNGGTTGSVAGNIVDNATLVFNRSDSPTFGGEISGIGALVQTGTGILTLAGSNSFSGGTTITSGALAINNANALPNSTVTVNAVNGLLFNTSGGALTAFNVGALAGSGNISLADGSHALTLNAGGNGAATTYSGGLSGAGGLTKTGGGILDLCGSNTYTGITSVAGSQLLLDFTQPGAPAANIVNNLSDSSSLVLSAGTLAMQGNAGFSNSQQFSGLTVNPGASAIVLASGGTSNSLVLSLGNISRGAAGGTIDFTPSAGSITTTTSNNATGILGAYATVGGADWACSSGTGGAAGNITAYSGYTSGDLGQMTSNGALNIELTGGTQQSNVTSAVSFNTLNLTGANGVTMVSPGSLTLLGGGLIGNTSGVISGGTLRGSSGTAGVLIVVTPQNLTIGSVIANDGGATALTKTGPATLILTGSNSYSGVTTIAAGALQLGNGGATGNLGSGLVVDGSMLVFDLSGTTNFSRAVSGIGSLTQAGNGTLILSGSNAYLGGTNVDAGTLVAASPEALPDGTSLTVGAEATSIFAVAAAAGPVEAGPVVAPSGVVAVPEPSTFALLAAGILLASCRRIRVASRRPLRGC
jgi:fibronectin-binding autotransporter adhesin